MPRWFKPILPRANDNNPLWNQVIFASMTGWDKALRSDIQGVTPTDRIKGINGIAISGPTMPYDTGDAGWALNSDNTSWFEYAIPLGLVGLFTANAPFSAAVLVRPNTIPPVTTVNHRIFQKRLNGAPTSPGFDIFLDTFISHTWSWEWSDGVAEQTLRTTIVPSTERTDLVVGVLDPVMGLAQVFVNGILENSAALLLNPVNPVALPIKIAGGIGPAGDDGGDSHVFMAALWNRALTARDIGQLYADPYILWRNPQSVRYLGQQVPPGVPPLISACCCPEG